MRVIFHPKADDEFQRAIEAYWLESVELGLRFYRSVLETVTRIEVHPQVWPRLRGPVRKCLVNEFPYKLLYVVETDRILVVAVMHGRRKPYNWVDRVRSVE